MFVSWKNINLKLQQSINHLDIRQENGKTALIWVILNLLPVWNLYGLASWNAWLWRMAWRDVVINLLIRMTGVVWTWVFSESSFGFYYQEYQDPTLFAMMYDLTTLPNVMMADDVIVNCVQEQVFLQLMDFTQYSPSTQRYQ